MERAYYNIKNTTHLGAKQPRNISCLGVLYLYKEIKMWYTSISNIQITTIKHGFNNRHKIPPIWGQNPSKIPPIWGQNTTHLGAKYPPFRGKDSS